MRSSITRLEIEHLITQANHPIELARHFIPSTPKILEAGGHYGEDTLRLVNLWPQSTIYTFEPNPSAYARLQNAIASNERIHSFPSALYHFDGRTKFYVQTNYNNDGASSILPTHSEYLEATQTHGWWYIDNEIEVSCITLDSWSKQNAVQTIDLIWLDIEGAELPALKSGTDLLKTVTVIYTEVNFEKYRVGMSLYDDLTAFLMEYGFKEIFFWGSRTDQGDALFLNSYKCPII